MTFRTFFALLTLFFISASCFEKKAFPENTGRPVQNPSGVDNPEGTRSSTPSGFFPDSSLTGAPVPALGKRVIPERFETSENGSLNRRPKVNPVHNNVKAAGTPKYTPIPAELPVVTPGENGVAMPAILPVTERIAPFRQPEPLAAFSPRMKEQAVYDIQYLDVEQGLISSYIRSILEDRYGNLWFGTSYGVSRYDGNYFFHYTPAEGLPDSGVGAMLEDSRGNIWFGTESGIARYNGQHFIHYTSDEGPVHEAVNFILEDSRGDIWFATTHGVFRYQMPPDEDEGERFFTHYTTREGLTDNYVMAILEDRRGRLWFATEAGISRLDPLENTIAQLTTEEGLCHDHVWSFTEDSRGNIWIGTAKGVSRYIEEEEPVWKAGFQTFTIREGLIDNDIRFILEDDQGNIWFATPVGTSRFSLGNGGVFTHFTTNEGFSNDQIRVILKDSKHNLWFGTGGGGANRYNGDSFRHFTTREGLSNNSVISMEEDQEGNLWIATGGGVSRYTPNDRPDLERFTHYTVEDGLICDLVNDVLEDSRGDLWFATDTGATRYHPGHDPGNGESFTHFTTREGLTGKKVRAVMEDSRGNIWFATDKGASCYIGDDDVSAPYFLSFTTREGLISNNVRTILEDDRGDLWFASDAGVSRYDGVRLSPRSGPFTGADKASFIHYTTREGLSDNDVRALLQDSRGYLWLATGGGGVTRFDREREFIHFTTQDGLSNNFVWSLVEDRRKNIWMGTEKGISVLRFNPDAGDRVKTDSILFFTFDKGDGLKRIDFQANSVHLDRNNRLWWGSEGLTVLDLNKFELPSGAPKNLRLDHIEINQQFIDFRRMADETYKENFPFGRILAQSFDSVAAFHNYPEVMNLPHYLDHLTFHFSATDWAQPHKVEYQYIMEGLDQEWSNPGPDPRADYRNLPFGAYTFKVRVKGESSTWSAPFEYTFTIRPPWWHTWWAYLGYCLGLLAIGYLIFAALKRRWLLQNQLKREQEEAVRLKELDSFKSRLYINLTHELRTPLSVILGMTEQIQSDPGKHLQEGLPLIHRNGRQLLGLINQLLDLSKLENKSFKLHLQQGNIVPFLNYVTMAFHPFVNSKNLSLQFFTILEEVIMDYDPEQIKQVMTNLISNAVKFTPSGGAIKIRLTRRENELVIEVIDTGIGIDEKDLPYIFDRFYQADSSTTRKGEGTGIGLAHTLELVKLMDGRIEAKSNTDASAESRGTKVEVVLPIRRAATTPLMNQETIQKVIPKPEEVEGNIRAVPENYENGALPGNHLTAGLPQLLIIEDNPDAVTYLKSCLEGQYQLDIAFNGKIGIEKALETIPDIIISDVMMPEKDGYEVCHTLKNDDRTSHIPIILLTARADTESKISGLKTGADAYLFKPFDKKELSVRLEMMVKKQKSLMAYFARKFQNGIVLDTPTDHSAEEAPKEDAFIERIRRIVEENYSDENFGLPQLCQTVGMSRSQLYRKMIALINSAPSDFIRNYRLEKGKIFLETTDLNVSEVAYKTGYRDVPHFSRSFQDKFGCPPSETNK